MIDANGTSFQLLLGPEDWRAAMTAPESENVVWEADKGSVALEAVTQRFPPRPGEPRLTPNDRRGADCDCFGNWYWIEADQRSIRTWRAGQEASAYWSTDALGSNGTASEGDFQDKAEAGAPYADLVLSGLCVNTRHFLLVGTLEPAGMLVFDLHAAGGPVFTTWDPHFEIEIHDLDCAVTGATWILDRTRRLLWQLDARMCLVPFAGTQPEAVSITDFAPKDASPEPGEPAELPIGLDLSLPGPGGTSGVSDPVAVIGLPDNTALVLDVPVAAPSRILRFGPGGQMGAVTLDASALEAFEAPPDALRGHDIAFLPDPNAEPGEIRGALLLVDDQGDQALRFSVEADAFAPSLPAPTELSVTLIPDYLPLRRYVGRALVAQEGSVYGDLGERWLALATHPRRRRRTEGMLGPVRFDAGQAGTAWHRIVMDACVPAGSNVTVLIRAADDPGQLDAMPFNELPRPYKRAEGPETPFWEPFPDTGDASGTGSWETLVQTGRGRFLDLQLNFAGDGTVTPRIRALRLYAPRFSYLERYLPAVYREDAVSANFLERFLANVEGLFTAMEDRVATAHGLMDTRIAPAEALDWLAGWVGAVLGPDWDDDRRRLFIDNAELLFRKRGTPAGLKALIDIATDPCPDASLLDGLRLSMPPEPNFALRGVRLSEAYQNPPLPGAGATVNALIGWTPEDGAAPLHSAFAAFVLDRRGPDLAQLSNLWGRPITSQSAILLTPLVPKQAAEAEDWRAFMAGPIGFPYAAATANDAPAWRSFLSRRYASLNRAAEAHDLVGGEIAPDALPNFMPTGGARLADWISFVSGVLPASRNAHRFTVLAPIDPSEDTESREARIAQITEVVERERPAHTAYDVRPYWALFQTGTARLGIDTTLGEGARFTAIELGRGALGEGFIGYGHPFAVKDRAVVGRDAAGEVRL